MLANFYYIIFIFNNLFAGYSQYEEMKVSVLTKHWIGISNARRGAFLESKCQFLS